MYELVIRKKDWRFYTIEEILKLKERERRVNSFLKKYLPKDFK